MADPVASARRARDKLGMAWRCLLPLPLLCACGSGLSTEQLEAVVEEGQPGLSECYNAALAEHPLKEEVRFTAEIRIAATGTVESVEFDQQPPIPGLGTCLRDTIGRWRFPQAEKATGTTLPLIFNPEVVQKPLE